MEARRIAPLMEGTIAASSGPGARMTEDGRKRIYWNERLSQHWGPEGSGSVAYGRQFNTWRYRVRARVFNRLVSRLALQPAGLTVLDVGCGTGFYLEQWQSLGVRSLAGLDISDWAVAQLAQTYPKATFYRADIGTSVSPLPDEAFDVVSALDVLVHLTDDDPYLRGLRNIHRTLRPGGYLFYSDSFFHGADKQFQDYWKGRSLSSVTEAMNTVGFDILCRVPMSVLMAPPTDTRRRERCEAVWEALMTPVRKREYIGFMVGALLYPLELLLVCTLKESPAIEIMVCRKRKIDDNPPSLEGVCCPAG
jgi:2-polyprenyl-3-methyl-5-hydroxy-6-metoxy-1,4-benzoquinol methylase